MVRSRLRRGCSLEVIFEEEDSTSADDSDRIAQREAALEERRQRRASRRDRDTQRIDSGDPRSSRRRARSLDTFLDKKPVIEEGSHSEGEESSEDIEWDPHRAPYVSRRSILQSQSLEDFQLLLDPCPPAESEEDLLSRKFCECCIAEEVTMPVAMETIPESILMDQTPRRSSAYAAFAAISQGSLTRKYREIFEGSSVSATPVERSDILQAIRACRSAKRSQSSPPSQTIPENISVPAHEEGTIRCDKCSSIIRTPPVSPSILDPTQQTTQDAEKIPETETETPNEHKKLSNQPSNREVVEEELPKPDTVKNARSVFETSSSVETYATLRPANRISHVKSNPSSKILRSESVDSKNVGSHPALDSFLRGRLAGQQTSKLSSPKATDAELLIADDKLYVVAVGGVSAMRWPTRKDPPMRSPSPPPLQKRAYYRSSPSLCGTGRLSRRSTDAESLVSEASDWSSDWESEASFSSGRDSLFDKEVEGRYVAPEVLRKIRSYGMTLTYINGRMIDENGVEVEKPSPPKPVKKAPPTLAKPKAKKNAEPVKPTAIKKPAAPPKEVAPRIISCVPKQTKLERSRHSSGESSASSGISSGRSDAESGSDGSSSPFASLKRTVSSSASFAVKSKDMEEDNRPPSPGPDSVPGAKSLASSRFGTYSVVYDFRHAGDNLRV